MTKQRIYQRLETRNSNENSRTEKHSAIKKSTDGFNRLEIDIRTFSTKQKANQKKMKKQKALQTYGKAKISK